MFLKLSNECNLCFEIRLKIAAIVFCKSVLVLIDINFVLKVALCQLLSIAIDCAGREIVAHALHLFERPLEQFEIDEGEEGAIAAHHGSKTLCITQKFGSENLHNRRENDDKKRQEHRLKKGRQSQMSAPYLGAARVHYRQDGPSA